MFKPNSITFREGQRVCRVSWRNEQPFLQVGTVTKVTRSTYYVDGNRTSKKWSAKGMDAINEEYRGLFQMWSILFGKLPDGWTPRDTVRCVCRVRRLERRLIRRRCQ